MLKWKQPNLEQLDYWESETGGFWITTRNFYSTSTGKSSKRWVLYSGELELGVYDSLDEAKGEAEPHEELKAHDPDCLCDVCRCNCDWHRGQREERRVGVGQFHRWLEEEPL